MIFIDCTLHVARVAIAQQMSRYIESLIKIVITINLFQYGFRLLRLLLISNQAFNFHTPHSTKCNAINVNENDFLISVNMENVEPFEFLTLFEPRSCSRPVCYDSAMDQYQFEI